MRMLGSFQQMGICRRTRLTFVIERKPQSFADWFIRIGLYAHPIATIIIKQF
jgi:hypothetical protein